MHALFRIAGPLLAAGMIVAGIAPASQAAGMFTVGTGSTSLGTVLVGATGRTLYTHAGDTSSKTTCTGGCAAAWPPLTAPAGQQPTAGPGVTGHLATLIRPEGATQVTYDGLPLYYWAGDQRPGDVTGQGIEGFSVAMPGGTAPKPATAIQGSICAGATRSGRFLSGRTLSIANGQQATIRFHLGPAFVGKSVTILVATKDANGHWSAYKPLAVRKVEADGYAYTFVRIHGMTAWRATYAGDSGHGAGTSKPVMANGH
jgi:predicted lipoprotein with Yx(FWY)xxD motif